MIVMTPQEVLVNMKTVVGHCREAAEVAHKQAEAARSAAIQADLVAEAALSRVKNLEQCLEHYASELGVEI
jgi:hypothetical protein